MWAAVIAPKIQSLCPGFGKKPDRGSRSDLFLRDQRTKGLITARFEMYNETHALDYCDNFADIVASGILVSCRWRANSYRFGHRCDSGDSQARHRSRSVDLGRHSHKCEGDAPSDGFVRGLNELRRKLLGRLCSKRNAGRQRTTPIPQISDAIASARLLRAR